MRPVFRLTATLALLMPPAFAGDDSQGFRIMGPAEVTGHLNAMEQLQGDEREQYRNRIYAELRQRARSHGYDMPVAPPWVRNAPPVASAEPAASAATATDIRSEAEPPIPIAAPDTPPEAATLEPTDPQRTAPEPDMPKLVAQQKRVIEEAVQRHVEEEKQTATTGNGDAQPAPDSYRDRMRKRFENFMARRKARQQSPAARPATPGTGATPQAGYPAAPVQPRPAYPQPYYPQPAFPRPYYPQPAYPAPQPAYPMPQPAYPAPPPAQPPFTPPPGNTSWY